MQSWSVKLVGVLEENTLTLTTEMFMLHSICAQVLMKAVGFDLMILS